MWEKQLPSFRPACRHPAAVSESDVAGVWGEHEVLAGNVASAAQLQADAMDPSAPAHSRTAANDE
jgi:hypothetical protein